ncbi:MAG: hypothetical protein HC837_19665 [Chloroflexaceae bacterium]|nr:hypothetical protein [Chloroflexaceae bacterium]
MVQRSRRWTLLLVLVLVLAACSTPTTTTGPSTPDVPSVGITPGPELTPTPVKLVDQFDYTAGGLTLRYPKDWSTQDMSGTLTLAPAHAAMAVSETDQTSTMVIFIDATPLDAISIADQQDSRMATQELFDLSSQGPEQEGYTLSATIPLTIDGQLALSADLQAEHGAGRLIVLMSPTRVVRILGQADATAWQHYQAVFEAIVESVTFLEAPPQPTPTPDSRALQPTLLTIGPPGFALRLGGNEGQPDGRFVSARGLATTSDGTLYLAESSKGIWVFEPDGSLIRTFGSNDVLDAYDVALDFDGHIFVADYGRNAIAHFAPDGTLVKRWGEAGNAPDQFGYLSPQRIAVDAEGSVYALDSAIDPNTGAAVNTIVRFNADDGSFIERIPLPPGSVPSDFAVDSLGNIYLAESFGKVILKIDRAGQVLARLGETALTEGMTPAAIDVDYQGNIYVATPDAGILKLSASGLLLSQVGTVAAPGTMPQAAQFSLPNGIAAGPNDVVWVSDNSGEYSAVTAVRLVTEAERAATAAALATTTPQSTAIPSDNLVRQWVASATASSSYNERYGPDSVVGPPDVAGCQDSDNAWASADPNGLDTLDVRFAIPVRATGITVYQNHQPGFISEVELLDQSGKLTSVYTATATLQNTCPFELAISWPMPTSYRAVGARITVDQRSGANWSEIDAIELVGLE